MPAGLFGKLAAQRDFVDVRTSRAFLAVWEPWLEASLRAAAEASADTWPTPFLTAPIWRFSLGADICGTPLAGALMPSMDAVGRCYPLTVSAAVDFSDESPDTLLAPWFDAVEALLLSTLDEHRPYDAILADLDALAPAPVIATAASESQWHTIGGDTVTPSSFSHAGLPPAALFPAMLAGLAPVPA